MIILMINSMAFMLVKHPMAMGMILLTQTTLMAAMTSKLSVNSWFSYILFLAMIGGLLILFIYMTSISSNNKFNSINKMIYLILIVPLMFTLTHKENPLINNNLLSKESFLSMLNKFMNYPSNWLYFMIIMYLLITLIVVIKITNNMKMPLRKK